ncbi:MAG: hypothetical protein ABSH33_18480 [Steroidobacteraceae bacterium]|jgi:hypothetical protein
MCSNQLRIKALAAACIALSMPGMTQIAGAASPTDACALLSQQQVATALGADVDAGKSIVGAGDCRWTGRAKRPGDEVAILQINLTKAQSFEIGKTPLPGWSKTPETGIGEDAYIVDSGKVSFPLSPTLSVKKGSAFFNIAAKVPKASSEQIKTVEKTVAVEILKKL